MLRLIILSFFMSSLVLANETPHAIGFEYSYSEINNNFSKLTSDLDDLLTSHYITSYQYQVTERIFIGIGYLKGDSSHADGLLIDLFTNSKIDYSAFLVSAAVNYPISKRNYLYLKVNALQYDYDVIDYKKVVYNDDGNDFGFSFGWMYNFDHGIGIKAGYEALSLGTHIDIKGFNIGISYRF